MFKKIIFLLASFWLPLFVRKKDYDLVILRYDSEKFMFNTKVFFEYLLENSKLNVKYIINDDSLREKLIKQYGNHFITQRTIQDIMFIAKAGSWITDGGFPLKTPFGHRDRVLINFTHGMPVKCPGILGYNGLSRLRIFLQLKMYSKYYDAFCVTSSKFKNIISKAYLLKEERIKILGQPRNDLLFRKNDKDKILKSLYPDLPTYEKIILYAPTYRSNLYGNSGLEPTKFFPFEDFDIKKLENFLEENQYIIFIRSHHLDKINFEETNRIRFLNSDKIVEISEILNIFDMLISDYSGMIFDFLLLNKPLIVLPYDYENYKENIGVCFEYKLFYELQPYFNFIAQDEFLATLKILLLNDEYKKERLKLKNKLFEITENNSEASYLFLLKKIREYNK